jgi:hypothetical protein
MAYVYELYVVDKLIKVELNCFCFLTLHETYCDVGV